MKSLLWRIADCAVTIIIVAIIAVICTWHWMWDDEPWGSEGY